MVNKEMIEEMLITNPLSLLTINDSKVIDYINSLVPYSSAFEIECDKGPNYNEANFTSIPDIMDVDNSDYEQRYRIPNGLKGILCLYNICEQLRTNSLLNPLSSIHYHCDCTDCYNDMGLLMHKTENVEWVLSQLDTWLGKDKATDRDYGSWFKMNSLHTIEFRLGEMTFDYKIILKRIIHCNQMTKHFKDEINEDLVVTYSDIDYSKLFGYYAGLQEQTTKQTTLSRLEFLLTKIKMEAEKLEEQKIIKKDTIDDYRNIIKNRVKLINPSN